MIKKLLYKKLLINIWHFIIRENDTEMIGYTVYSLQLKILKQQTGDNKVRMLYTGEKKKKKVIEDLLENKKFG